MGFGKLIVFEGPDNCGKTTQIGLAPHYLSEIFKEKDNKEITYTHYKFPRYGTFYGDIIKYMLTENKYDLIKDTDDIKLFMQIQLEDKLEGIKEIFSLLKQFDYVFLDRFSLSSRIYDASSLFLYDNKVDKETIENILKAMKNIRSSSERNRVILPNDGFNVYDFIDGWVFTNTFDYLNEPLREKFSYIYNILEHKIFDIKFVFFKSSSVIERLSRDEREQDQYEKGVYKKFINLIYDLSGNYIMQYKNNGKGIYNKDNVAIFDTAPLLSKAFPEYGYEGLDAEEAIFQYCKNNKASCTKMIAENIAEKIYGLLKNK
jgi:hypothetical protein